MVLVSVHLTHVCQKAETQDLMQAGTARFHKGDDSTPCMQRAAGWLRPELYSTIRMVQMVGVGLMLSCYLTEDFIVTCTDSHTA